MMRYRTKAGDVVDLICHRHYQGTSGQVEAVYTANPGLADLGPVLPAGIVILLPDPPPVAATIIRLWD